MSIATEIERINNAKASIKTAIEKKGVEVGNGTIDTYAEKIEAIETGVSVSLQEKNVTPSTVTQEITADENYDGLSKVTVEGDSNFIESNIRAGVTMWGKTGTMEGAWDSSHLRRTDYMFSGNNDIETAPMLNMENVTRADRMYYQDSNLTEIPEYNMPNNTNMSYFCSYCPKIKKLIQTKVSNATNFSDVCSNCTDLIEANFSTDSATNLGSSFYGCPSLKTVSELICDKVANVFRAFDNDRSLTNLGGFKNLGKAYTEKTANYMMYTLQLSHSDNITHDSLMNVINSLYDLNLTYDVANGGILYTQKLQIGSNNMKKLTAEEIRNCYC